MATTLHGGNQQTRLAGGNQCLTDFDKSQVTCCYEQPKAEGMSDDVKLQQNDEKLIGRLKATRPGTSLPDDINALSHCQTRMISGQKVGETYLFPFYSL